MSTKNFNTNTSNHDEWLTPKYITDALGPFSLDPCSPVNRPWATAERHFTIEDDGLSAIWEGRVWCNPPYGKDTFVWLERMARHKSGIALIFARTETKGFHKTIWDKAFSVFFFNGRLAFCYVDGSKGNTANAPSCLVSWSKEDSEVIQNAYDNFLISGKHVYLNQ